RLHRFRRGLALHSDRISFILSAEGSSRPSPSHAANASRPSHSPTSWIICVIAADTFPPESFLARFVRSSRSLLSIEMLSFTVRPARFVMVVQLVARNGHGAR